MWSAAESSNRAVERLNRAVERLNRVVERFNHAVGRLVGVCRVSIAGLLCLTDVGRPEARRGLQPRR